MLSRTELNKQTRRAQRAIDELLTLIRPYLAFAMVLFYTSVIIKSYYLSQVLFYALLNAAVIICLIFLIHSIQTKN